MISAAASSVYGLGSGGSVTFRPTTPDRDRSTWLRAIDYSMDSATLSMFSAPDPFDFGHGWSGAVYTPRPFDLGSAVFAQGLTRSGLDGLWGRLIDAPLDNTMLDSMALYGPDGRGQASLMSRLIDAIA